VTKKCSICGKTAFEKIQEQKEMMIAPDNLSAKISTELGGVELCDDCQGIMLDIIPAVLERLDILSYDEESENYKLSERLRSIKG
jgi:hypothetical protein